jgi:hypothetical protein
MRDLRGQTLRGADLRGADLHGADLRGVDLTGADLREADLREARTGLGRRAVVVQTLAALAVAATGGFASSVLGQTIRRAWQSPSHEERIGGVVLAAELFLCLATMTWRGTGFTLQRVLPPTVGLLLLTSLGLIVLHGSVRGSGLVILAVVILFVVMIAAVTLARAIAAGISRLVLVAVLAAWLVAARGASGNLTAMLVAVATGIAGMRAAGGSLTSPGLSRWVRRFTTWGGTSFRSADLRNANLADARLRCSDLRGAHFDGVEWGAAREVDFCRFDEVPGVPARKKLAPAFPRVFARAR